MGDSLPRRLSVSVAPTLAGSSLSHILPLHEARHEEGRLRGERERQEREIELLHLNTDFEHEYDTPTTDEDDRELLDGSSTQMPPKSRNAKSPNPRTLRSRPSLEASAAASNGHAPENGKAMNGSFRERSGKHGLAIDTDGDSSRATTRLMGRSSFSLDHLPSPLSPSKSHDAMGGSESKGFFELPEQDRRNFLLLVLLYFLQGIPMGLAGGSVPFLLKEHLSYAQIGVYSLASYPYSLKLLWSPIVDAVWSTRVGRRKSWILPIQLLSGFGMLWLGARASAMMAKAGEDGGAGVWGFTGWWFALVFMCATQDIAVDGMEHTTCIWNSGSILTMILQAGP